ISFRGARDDGNDGSENIQQHERGCYEGYYELQGSSLLVLYRCCSGYCGQWLCKFTRDGWHCNWNAYRKRLGNCAGCKRSFLEWSSSQRSYLSLAAHSLRGSYCCYWLDQVRCGRVAQNRWTARPGLHHWRLTCGLVQGR